MCSSRPLTKASIFSSIEPGSAGVYSFGSTGAAGLGSRAGRSCFGRSFLRSGRGARSCRGLRSGRMLRGGRGADAAAPASGRRARSRAAPASGRRARSRAGRRRSARRAQLLSGLGARRAGQRGLRLLIRGLRRLTLTLAGCAPMPRKPDFAFSRHLHRDGVAIHAQLVERGLNGQIDGFAGGDQ